MSIELVSATKCFDGWQKRFQHSSEILSCKMRFAIFLPPQPEGVMQRLPVLYWLSGLTCNEENFIHKAGAQRMAAELGIVIVAVDTSPRGEGVADDPEYDLGQGAGFYLNATQQPWLQHYQMYDYVLWELPQIIEHHFPVNARRALAGHSMGGHGALVLGLRNADRYQSISAFSPICNPMACPWGEKAFSAYLGTNKASWREYDASALLQRTDKVLPILISQGEEDAFLEPQLRLQALQAAATIKGHPLIMERHAGYDHSYHFIATFIEQHLRFHADYLLKH